MIGGIGGKVFQREPGRFGALRIVLENALDIDVVVAPAGIQADPARVAIEQRPMQVRFEHANAVGDGGGRDAQFFGGAHEVLVARGGVEESQAIQRWKIGHD